MTMRIRNAHIRKFADPDFRPPLLSLSRGTLFDRRKRAMKERIFIGALRVAINVKVNVVGTMIRLPILFYYQIVKKKKKETNCKRVTSIFKIYKNLFYIVIQTININI